MRVVVSYTTLPDRYPLLRKSIESIEKSDYPIDKIYLTVPKLASRLNQVYEPLPVEIANKCDVLYIDLDYGPICKIYGALDKEKDPETIIISCDDDIIYPPNLISSLIHHSKNFPESAICGTGGLLRYGVYGGGMFTSLEPYLWINHGLGFHVSEVKGRKIDLIFGVAGVLYKRKFFPYSSKEIYEQLWKYALMDHSVFCNDDVLISGYLARQKITRRVFADIPQVRELPKLSADALSYRPFHMLSRMENALQVLKKQGFFPYFEEQGYDEIIVLRALWLIALIIIIVLIILIFLFWIFGQRINF